MYVPSGIAEIAARLTAVTTLTDVTTVVDALHRTMEKIHRNADIEVEVHQQATLRNSDTAADGRVAGISITHEQE